MRKLLIMANWKMNKTAGEAVAFFDSLPALPAEVDTAVFAPLTALDALSKAPLAGVGLGAQNFHPAAAGAFTGEVSLAMLAPFGVRYVLTGHSERRDLFKESDAFVAEKYWAAADYGMMPVLCVGESMAIREAGGAEAHTRAQLDAVFGDMTGRVLPKEVIIAYEPIWAIGTGLTATAEDAEAMCASLRAHLADRLGKDVAAQARILYGGSVKPDNCAALFAQENIDGGLIGGASLEPASFAALVEKGCASCG
ncbi:triose-phosphate isomerase [Peptococcus simiae]|uniref:Triosephosphate isomerase n=1 Tax=Peptococcus simiae TaxID=1643805 RepID=A0ABW9H150_9FIRM